MVAERVRAARTIARRELFALLRSPSPLVALGVALTAASLGVRTVLGEIAESGLLARASPLYFPLFVATVVLASALAISSTLSVAREREAGTLEVLFYGPVDATACVVGKYAAQVLAYLALCPLLAASLLAYAWLTSLRFSGDLVLGLLLSALAAACTIAFGIFLSTLCGSIRAAILILVGVGGALIAVQAGSWLLAGLPARSVALAVVGPALAAANHVVNVVSPFAYLDRGMEAALVGDPGAYAGAVLSSLVYVAVLLVGATWSLHRRGVRP
jgi:ABC-type transport system involved in multi-copper enzyme maturation permease subunit